MVERVESSLVQPAASGRGRGSVGVAVGVALEEHRHEWCRLLNAVGLFSCRDRGCLWCAVCPGCLGSLDVALRARDGVVGMALYWCPAHQGGGTDDGQS